MSEKPKKPVPLQTLVKIVRVTELRNDYDAPGFQIDRGDMCYVTKTYEKDREPSLDIRVMHLRSGKTIDLKPGEWVRARLNRRERNAGG